MKMLITAMVAMFSASSLAAQSVNCRELNKDGTLREGGGKIRLAIALNAKNKMSFKNSTVRLSGFTVKGSTLFKSVNIQSLNEGVTLAQKKPYTTFFFSDETEAFDLQLQFDRHVVSQSFKSERATFVIGSEDGNPEFGSAFGYPMTCNSRVN